MNTLSNRDYLITRSTMQSLSLDNNEPEEAMNSHFTNAENSHVVQSPISLKSPKKAFNTASPVVDSFPFLGFREQSLLVGGIYLDDWLCPVLVFDNKSQFLTAIASVTNDIVRVESAIGESRLAENTGGNTDIAQTSTRDIGSYSENRLID